MELKLAKCDNGLTLRLPLLVTSTLRLEHGDALKININQLREIVLAPANNFNKSEFLLKLQDINSNNSYYQIPVTQRHIDSSSIIYVDSSVMVSMFSNNATSGNCISWFSTLKTTPICSECLITEFNSTIALMQISNHLTDEKLKLILTSFEALIKGGVKLLTISRDVSKHFSQVMLKEPDISVHTALHLSFALASKATEFVTVDISQYQYAKKLGLSCRLIN